MSNASSSRYDFPMTPEQFAAMLAQAEPSVFFSLTSSVVETISAAIRLFRGTSDEYRAVNHNWARTSSVLFRTARSVALLIALFLFIFAPAAAASMFFGGIVTLTAIYNLGKAGWSFYKLISSKDKDPAHKADLKKHFKANLLGAAFSVAAAVVMFALVASPIAAATLTALAITASVIGFVMLAYTVFQFVMKHRKKTSLLEKPAEEAVNPEKDADIIEQAEVLSASHDKMTFHDYQYAVNYSQVIHTLTSRESAHQFLKKEILEYRLRLEQQSKRDSWLDHVQAKKRAAKLTVLDYFDDFLDHLNDGQCDPEQTFPEAFKTYLQPKEYHRYSTLKNLSTQSFCRHKGRLEDLMRGIGQHTEQVRLDRYANPCIVEDNDMAVRL